MANVNDENVSKLIPTLGDEKIGKCSQLILFVFTALCSLFSVSCNMIFVIICRHDCCHQCVANTC